MSIEQSTDPTPADDLPQGMLARMTWLANHLTSEDLANLSYREEKPIYLGPQRASGGYKGGKPPVDYQAVEVLVDFQAALREGQYEAAIGPYYQLIRLTNFS